MNLNEPNFSERLALITRFLFQLHSVDYGKYTLDRLIDHQHIVTLDSQPLKF